MAPSMIESSKPVSSVDPDLVAMLGDVFSGHRGGYAVAPDVITWDDGLWSTLTELGLARLTGSEESGGSGAGWPEAAELLRAAASAGVAVPVVEHDLLAGWLLETAGIAVDDARRSACIIDESGVAESVGWAAGAERIVVLHRLNGSLAVADVDRATARITPGTNRAGEPRDRVEIDLATLNGKPVPDNTAALFRLRGALARGIQVSGALESILRLCLQHTESRTQFGRPLSKFQAVQHAVADIATQAALSRVVTDGAVLEAHTNDWEGSTAFRIAVARSCAGHAASVSVRSGHQVHGAIGTTREHTLHEFTRPALAWRNEFGTVSSWDHAVADAAFQAGSTGLWSLITS